MGSVPTNLLIAPGRRLFLSPRECEFLAGIWDDLADFLDALDYYARRPL